MRVLLTGGQGFIGTWLQRSLVPHGHHVAAPAVDLFDVEALRALLTSETWDAIIHLAAVSHNADAQVDPELAWRTNVGATALLADLIAEHCPATHLVFPSTAHVYAAARTDEDDLVITEDRRIAPVNVYGATKWAGEVLLRDVATRRDVRTTVLRLFNHTHCSQPTQAFLPYLLTSLRGPQASNIPVGNLHVERDFGSLADLLSAFAAVLEAPQRDSYEVYNVCSGRGVRLQELADDLAARLGVQARFVVDASRVREGEPSRMLGSHARLTAATGWRPTTTDTASFLNAFLDENPIPGTRA